MEIDSNWVVCPYCDNKTDGYDEFEGHESEESKEIQCEECSKKFWARKVVSVDYRTETDCSLNGEKHEKGKYHCNKCDVYNCNCDDEVKEESTLK